MKNNFLSYVQTNKLTANKCYQTSPYYNFFFLINVTKHTWMQNVGYFFYCLKKRVTTFTYTSRTLGRRQTTNDIQQEERLSQRINGIFSHKLDFLFFFFPDCWIQATKIIWKIPLRIFEDWESFFFFFLKSRLGDINCCQMIYYLCVKKKLKIVRSEW